VPKKSRRKKEAGIMLLIWWRLVYSPTSYHDYSKLELSGAWEPSDSS